ncbi:hypothetical protein CsSME_00018754 [Camellia sinensis var. sinensis]
MTTTASLISCNFSFFPLKNTPKFRISPQNPNSKTPFLRTSSSFHGPTISHSHRKKGLLQICLSSMNTQNSQNPQNPDLEREDSLASELGGHGGRTSSSPGGDGGDWTTSFLLFLLWGGLMYYIFNLTPNQTPVLLCYNAIQSFNCYCCMFVYWVVDYTLLQPSTSFFSSNLS